MRPFCICSHSLPALREVFGCRHRNFAPRHVESHFYYLCACVEKCDKKFLPRTEHVKYFLSLLTQWCVKIYVDLHKICFCSALFNVHTTKKRRTKRGNHWSTQKTDYSTSLWKLFAIKFHLLLLLFIFEFLCVAQRAKIDIDSGVTRAVREMAKNETPFESRIFWLFDDGTT